VYGRGNELERNTQKKRERDEVMKRKITINENIELDWFIIILKTKRKHTVYFLILASDAPSLFNLRRFSDKIL